MRSALAGPAEEDEEREEGRGVERGDTAVPREKERCVNLINTSSFSSAAERRV